MLDRQRLIEPAEARDAGWLSARDAWRAPHFGWTGSHGCQASQLGDCLSVAISRPTLAQRGDPAAAQHPRCTRDPQDPRDRFRGRARTGPRDAGRVRRQPRQPPNRAQGALPNQLLGWTPSEWTRSAEHSHEPPAANDHRSVAIPIARCVTSLTWKRSSTNSPRSARCRFLTVDAERLVPRECRTGQSFFPARERRTRGVSGQGSRWSSNASTSEPSAKRPAIPPQLRKGVGRDESRGAVNGDYGRMRGQSGGSTADPPKSVDVAGVPSIPGAIGGGWAHGRGGVV